MDLRPGEHEQRQLPNRPSSASSATPVEMSTDGDPRHRGDEQGERERAGQLRRGVAELPLHRHQKDGERVVEDSHRVVSVIESAPTMPQARVRQTGGAS